MIWLTSCVKVGLGFILLKAVCIFSIIVSGSIEVKKLSKSSAKKSLSKSANDFSLITFFLEIERWRDRLIADDAAVTDYISTYPTTDRAQLRALIRAARKRTDDPTAFRTLFRHLRDNAALHAAERHADDPDDASVPPTVT